MKGAVRQDVFDYANKMGIEPEFLWTRFSNYAVLRRPDNDKWFALVMDVPADRLGLDTGVREDIVDLRVEPELNELLSGEEGFLPGYHLSPKNWIAVRLDGSVDKDKLFALIDGSYNLVAPKRKRK